VSKFTNVRIRVMDPERERSWTYVNTENFTMEDEEAYTSEDQIRKGIQPREVTVKFIYYPTEPK
jgi:hypothetical protein